MNFLGLSSLRRRLVVIMCLAYVVAAVISGAVGYVTQRDNLRHELEARAQSDAKILAAGSVSSLNVGTVGSYSTLQHLLTSLRGSEGVSFAEVRGGAGCILASTRVQLVNRDCGTRMPVVTQPTVRDLPDGSIEGLAPIAPAGEGTVLGIATVVLSSASIQSALLSTLLLDAAVRGIGLLGFIFLSLFIAQFTLGPLRGLARAARDVRQNKLGSRVPVRGHTEIDTVAEAFNEMAAALETRIRHLSFLASSGAALPGTLRGNDDVEPILQDFGEALGVRAAGLLGSDGPVVWWPDETDIDAGLVRSLEGESRAVQTVRQADQVALVIPVPGDAWFVAVRPAGSPFTDEEQQVIANFAYQLGIAADNARLLEAQQEALQVKDQFLSIVSHELRTPLTTMKGYAQLLGRRLDGDMEGQRFAGSIDAQITRLSRLVDDLLDVTRFARGQFELRRGETDLVPVLQDVVSRFRIISPEHAIRLETDGASLTGTWDRDRLEQVLNNLVGNAIKYSPDGGEIVIAADRRETEVVVRVRDQGVGISAEDQDKLFERFYRASTERRGDVKGLGLGLYVTRRVVEAHGGTVGVDSALGEGSEFYFTLPLEPAVERRPRRRVG